MTSTGMSMAVMTSAIESMSMDMANMSSSMSSMVMAMASSSMSMAMETATGSMSMAMATATGSGSSSGGMAGMHMGSSSSCKISMLWNWNTIDACFISKDWHVSTRGQFAGTCIGVFVWVLALELWRRFGREMDRYFVRMGNNTTVIRGDSPSLNGTIDTKGGSSCGAGGNGAPVKNRFFGTLAGPRKTFFSPTLFQQIFRALRYAVEFGAVYLLMLMAMYYNGYVLITMWLGAFFGYFLFATDTVGCDTTKGEAHCC